MPTPSLLIVPSRFKSGKLYSQIPTSGAGDFTVTRATAATRVNASGLIESVASGIPRLDYFASGGTVGCPALLVEPSGTNLYQQSEDFNNVYWNKANCVVSGNLTIAPDGNLTADKLIISNGILPNAANQSGINRSETITSGTYRFSVFAKAAEFTGFRVRENLVQGTFLDVNLTNGAITNGDVTQFINPLAENYGNGWYRISWTSPTITSLTKYSIRVGSTGDGVSGIFIWGAQVETSSVATSYIPTTTGSITRNADVVSVSGAVSGSIGQTEGVLYIECESNDGVDDVFFINRSVTNGIALYKTATNAYIGRIHHSSNTITFQSSNNVSGMVKIAIAYKSGDSTMYLNGSRVGTLNTNAITFGAALNTLGVNKDPYFAGAKPSRIRAVALYNTRLTDAQLAALTSP